MIRFRAGASVRPVAQLGDDNRAEAQATRRRALNAGDHSGVAAAQVVDAGVRIEEVSHGSIELGTRLDRLGFLRVRKIVR